MTPDEILQGCLEDLETGAMPLDEYLSRYLDAAYLAGPLQAAESLRSLPRPSLSPEAQAAHQAQLRAAVQAQTLARPARTPARRLYRPSPVVVRWATAVALLFAVVLGSTTTVAAASGSVPGEGLYPIKRTSEVIRLAFTPPSAQAALHLALAEERAEELTTVVERGQASPQVIDQLTTDLLAQSDLALDKIKDAPEAQRAELLVLVQASAASHQALLVTVNAEMAATAQAGLEVALATAEANSSLAAAQLTRLPDATGLAPAAASPTRAATATPTPLPTNTVVPAATASPTPSQTARPSATVTPSPTATATSTRMPSATRSPASTATLTSTPPATSTVPPAPSQTPQPTATPLPTETLAPTWTPLPTDTQAPTATTRPSDTPTPTSTTRPTDTATPNPTETPLPTWTPSPTETLTPTATPSQTPEPSPTACPTNPGGQPVCRRPNG